MAVENLYATSLASGTVATSANALGSTSGTWTTDTGNVSWTAVFAMGDPTGTVASGNHTFTARVRKIAGQTGTPTAQVNVHSPAGTVIATGTTTNVTSGTGQDVTTTVAASTLNGVSLTDLAVEIVTVAAGGAGGVRTPVQLDYILWSGDFVVNASVTPTVIDGVVSFGAPTVEATSPNADITASVIACSVSFGAPTVEAGSAGGGVPTVDNITVTAGDAASPGAITGTLPNGTGDLLVAFVFYDNVTVTAPGWTVQDSRIVGGTADIGVTMLTAPSDVSSLTFTPTDTTRAGVVTIYRISGASGMEAVAGIGALGNTTATTRAIPTVTTTVDNCLLISGVACDSTGGTNYTWPSPWTEQTDSNVTGDTGLRGSTATTSQATAGTTPGGNVTFDISDHHGIITIALAPGGGGTNANVTPSVIACTTSFPAPTVVGENPDASISASEILCVTSIPTPTVSDGIVLPGPISGVPVEAGNSFMGPVVDSNGNFYYVMEEYLADGNHPMMMKSSDGGQTWVRQDAANNPTGAGAYNDMESGWIALRPTANELVLCYMKGMSRWWGMSFRTSDHPTNPDTWNTGTFATSSGQDQFGTIASESGIACAVLSDGTVRAFIRGTPQGGNQAFLHRTKATTTWDTGSTYITHTGVDMTRPACVVGESNTTALFYKDQTNGRVYYRTVSSSGTVGDPVRVDTNGAGTGASYENNVVPPVYYDDAGDEVLVVGFVNSSNVLRTVEVRNGTPGSEQVVSTDTVTVDPTTTDSMGPSAALAVLGTTVYAVWGDATSGDLYYASRANGGSWSSRTLITDTGTGGSVQWLSANVLTSGSSLVLGCVYDVGPHDDEDVSTEYNQVVLATIEDANVSPSTIQSTTSFPAGGPSAAGDVVPTTIECLTTFPGATVVSGTQAAVTASEIQATTSFGAATVSIDQTAAPATIQATVTFPEGTVTAGGAAAVTASTIQATTSFGASTFVVDAPVPEPATIQATTSFGSATYVAGTEAAVTAVTIQATTSFGASTATVDAPVPEPATIQATTSFGSATYVAGTEAAVTASTIQAITSFGAATFAADAPVSAPATIQATTSFGAASVGAGSQSGAAPSVIQASTSFSTPTLSADSAPQPATIQGSVSFGGSTITATYVAAPPTTQGTTSFGAFSVSAAAAAIATTVQATTTFGAPSVASASSANISPVTINATVIIPQPGVSAGGATQQFVGWGIPI